MEATLSAIETTGTVDEQRQLHLDGDLPVAGPRRVRVIVLYSPDEDPDELTWLGAAARSSVFSSLAEEEDLYSLSDGKPFRDEE